MKQWREIACRTAAVFLLSGGISLAQMDGPAGPPHPNVVELPASAGCLSGGIRFANSIGWTTDWLTDWQSTDGRLWWELDVVRPGRSTER